MSRRSVVVRRCRVKVVVIGVLVVAFLGTAGTTHAGIIPFGSYSGVGSTPPLASNAQVFTTVTPMNDNSPASNNFIASNRSEEHTSELQSHSDLVCRLLLEKKKKKNHHKINN